MSTPVGPDQGPPRVPGPHHVAVTAIGVATAAVGAVDIAVNVAWWAIAAGIYVTAAGAGMVGAAVVHTYQHHRKGRRRR